MSGVLERMVQRTRGTLAAAEPRIAASTLPRQAPSSADNADWLGEVHVQVEGGLRTDRRSASTNDSFALPLAIVLRASTHTRPRDQPRFRIEPWELQSH